MNIIQIDNADFFHRRKVKLPGGELTKDSIDTWNAERAKIGFAVELSNGKIVSVCLLSRQNIDRDQILSTPYYIHYIHTVSGYRRQGYASALLDHLKSLYNLVTWTGSDQEDCLFQANGFKLRPYVESGICPYYAFPE